MKKFKEDIDKQYMKKCFHIIIEPALKDIIEKLSNLDIGFLDSCPSIKKPYLKIKHFLFTGFSILKNKVL